MQETVNIVMKDIQREIILMEAGEKGKPNQALRIS